MLHQIRQLLPKAPTLLNQFLVPVGDVSVRKESVIQALRDKGLDVPGPWIGKGLTQDARVKGGSKPKWKPDLQEIINWIGNQIRRAREVFTESTFRKWLRINANYEYSVQISGLPTIWIDEKRLYWMHSEVKSDSISLRSLKPYVDRANSQIEREPAP